MALWGARAAYVNLCCSCTEVFNCWTALCCSAIVMVSIEKPSAFIQASSGDKVLISLPAVSATDVFLPPGRVFTFSFVTYQQTCITQRVLTWQSLVGPMQWSLTWASLCRRPGCRRGHVWLSPVHVHIPLGGPGLRQRSWQHWQCNNKLTTLNSHWIVINVARHCREHY